MPDPYPTKIVKQRTAEEQAREVLKSYGLHDAFKQHITAHGGVKNDYDKAMLLMHPEMRVAARNHLIISLFPPTAEGEFILERNITAATRYPDQLESANHIVVQLPPDVAVTRVPHTVTPQAATAAIVASIDAHFKTHGRMDLLEIVGHGRTNTTALGENAATSPTLDNKMILKAILHYQQTHHVQVAETLLLGGCNVMSNLTERDAEAYNALAKQLKMTVKGSTITVLADGMDRKGISGLFVTFDGSQTAGVDTALSHLHYYMKTRPQLGTDSVTIDSKAQIKEQSQWLQDYNAKHGKKGDPAVDMHGYLQAQDSIAAGKPKPPSHQK